MICEFYQLYMGTYVKGDGECSLRGVGGQEWAGLEPWDSDSLSERYKRCDRFLRWLSEGSSSRNDV